MPAPLAAIGAKAIGSGFGKEVGKQMLAGGGRRSMSGGDDMISFAGRGGIGDPSDKKQGQIMSDQMAGELATKGLATFGGPKGMLAAKIIETVPGGKEVVGKVANTVINNNPAKQIADNLGGFRAGKDAKADIGGMKGPSMGLPGLTPPKLS